MITGAFQSGGKIFIEDTRARHVDYELDRFGYWRPPLEWYCVAQTQLGEVRVHVSSDAPAAGIIERRLRLVSREVGDNG